MEDLEQVEQDVLFGITVNKFYRFNDSERVRVKKGTNQASIGAQFSYRIRRYDDTTNRG